MLIVIEDLFFFLFVWTLLKAVVTIRAHSKQAWLTTTEQTLRRECDMPHMTSNDLK